MVMNVYMTNIKLLDSEYCSPIPGYNPYFATPYMYNGLVPTAAAPAAQV